MLSYFSCLARAHKRSSTCSPCSSVLHRFCAHASGKSRKSLIAFIFNFAAAGWAKNLCHVSMNVFFRFAIWRLQKSFKEKECVFNFFFSERKTLMQSWIVVFFIFLIICLLPAGDKQNVAREYNICKWFHLVYVVAISVMTNTATLNSWVKRSVTSNSLKIQYPLFANGTTRIRLHTLTFQARVWNSVPAQSGMFRELTYLSINNR